MTCASTASTAFLVINLIALVVLTTFSWVLYSECNNFVDNRFIAGITPPDWTLITGWLSVQSMQLLWHIYYIYRLIVSDDQSPELLPPTWTALLLFSTSCNIVWLFMIHKLYIDEALWFIATSTIILLIITIRSHGVHVWKHTLLRNALMLDTVWLMMATAMTVGVAVKHVDGDEKFLTFVVLWGFTGAHGLYAIIDILFLNRKYTKCSFTSYLIIILYSCVLVVEQPNLSAIVLLSTTLGFLTCKIILCACTLL
ncbi:hypothetical protein ElyMa_004523200 [Elysia marginata]|uniref:Post-GPI attachment to proteins factor 3 n=1 Tax=Elysia marginata TaxID=1093978 RepID=A0AAV4HMX7_9GAST|nr:hypothetical protein ElyMa_004523200 [Elysia marginata]